MMDRAQKHGATPPESLRGRVGGPAHGAGGAEPGAERLEIDAAFARAVDAIAHDPAFAEVEIVSSAAHRHGRTTALHVMLDREGGVDVKSCERIAAHINDALEDYPDLYTLEVESAGLDRPLVKPGDYERFSGREVKIVTTLAIGNAKTHRGRLDGVRGSTVILSRAGGELPIPLAVIKSANLEYDVRADLQRAKNREKNR